MNCQSKLRLMHANVSFPTNAREFTERARIACLNLTTPVAGGTVQEPFATKLKRAVKARIAAHSSTRTAHAEQAERERNRYRPFLQRRPHCKGE